MAIQESSALDILGLPGELVGIVLGWTLGLLSPLLVWYVLRARQRKELIRAIKGELAELRVTFAMDAHSLQERTGAVDDQFLNWLIAALEETPGADPRVPQYTQALKHLLTHPVAARAPGASTQLLMKPHRMVLAEANYTHLGMCPMSFQQRVINIARAVANWTEDTRFLEGQFKKTFDPNLSAVNRQIVEANVQRTYEKALRAAIGLVDDIGVAVRAT